MVLGWTRSSPFLFSPLTIREAPLPVDGLLRGHAAHKVVKVGGWDHGDKEDQRIWWG